MQVGQLCTRLKLTYRHARYVLEQGILPAGVDEKPGKGDHRQLTPPQAFWLAIVLFLKESGVQTPLAGKIADYAREAVRTVTQNLSWEHTFHPFLGRFKTEHQWFVDIGDLKYIRLATTANPSHDGLYEFPWTDMNKREVKNIRPVVILRLDLSGLAQRFQD